MAIPVWDNPQISGGAKTSILPGYREAKRLRWFALCATAESMQSVLGYRGPPQPSSAPGDALNTGYLYLEVRCLGCNTHQTVALNIRPSAEDDLRSGTLFALQRLSLGSRLSIQSPVAAV
jgi:hypothetical protein